MPPVRYSSSSIIDSIRRCEFRTGWPGDAGGFTVRSLSHGGRNFATATVQRVRISACFFFRRYPGLVADELLSADVIVRYTRVTEYLPHAGDHSRRASDVENWSLKIWKPFPEHRFGNVTKFSAPVAR
jgi:hypothetical protein